LKRGLTHTHRERLPIIATPHATNAAIASPWAPFRHRVYAVVWTATVVANIGGWMYSAAAAWLMTELTTDPLLVSLVQVATSLPMFLFALVAGAMTDIVDKRRYLIGVEIAIVVVSAIFATLVTLDLVTAPLLLGFMFVVASGSAFDAPAWQAIVPMLVPREDLQGAVAANSVGVNISRAIGPALSGVVTAAFGLAAPFWLDVCSNFATIGALSWWRPARPRSRRLPAERLASAIRIGVRYARNNPPLRATLVRAVAFFLFASAYWALLPLLARAQIRGGAEVYGVLLGAIGAGAVGGAFALPRLKAKLGADRLAVAATVGTAAALVLYALAHTAALAFVASLVAGACWIAAISTFNVSAQLALPDWVRGRGLAIYVTVFFGALTIGSALWGEIAARLGLPVAHLLAAFGALAGIPLTRRAHLQAAARLDLTPSMHWPTPVVVEDLEPDTGPVMVMIEYDVQRAHRDAFVDAMDAVARERRRDGAYAWGLYEDTAKPDRLVETFLVESWMEHLRQHQRVTKADEALQERVRQCLQRAPAVTHLVDAEAMERASKAGARVGE
jgi:MFS family permease/quinol monooxygenase YgiN